MGDRVSKPRFRCPRCDYDLGGVVQTWTGQCPLHGLCSECGLDFEWSEIFDSTRSEARWCAEFGRWRGLPWRLPLTLLLSAVPWWFWSKLRLSHRVRWGRLLTYLAFVLALTWIMVCVEHGVREARASYWSGAPTVAGYLRELQSFAFSPAQTRPGPPTVPDHVTAGARATWWTFTGRSSEFMKQLGRDRSWARRNAALIVIPPLLGLLMPLAFVTVPISRRRRRVRWRHIFRVWVYLLPCSLVPLWFTCLVYDAERWPEILIMNSWLSVVCLTATPLLLLVAWGSATRCYLKLPHAWTMAGAFLLIAILLLLACGYWPLVVEEVLVEWRLLLG